MRRQYLLGADLRQFCERLRILMGQTYRVQHGFSARLKRPLIARQQRQIRQERNAILWCEDKNGGKGEKHPTLKTREMPPPRKVQLVFTSGFSSRLPRAVLKSKMCKPRMHQRLWTC
jgi:hypothetical protein